MNILKEKHFQQNLEERRIGDNSPERQSISSLILVNEQHNQDTDRFNFKDEPAIQVNSVREQIFGEEDHYNSHKCYINVESDPIDDIGNLVDRILKQSGNIK